MVLLPYVRAVPFCLALAASVGGTAKTARAETPLSSLAPAAGTRLVPLFLTAEDEARQFVGWYDAARGETCSFALSGDGVLRCLPTDVVEANLFADASCTLAIAAVSTRAMPRYLTAVQARPLTAQWGAGRYVYELGRHVQPAAVYLHSGANCARTIADSAATYLALGRVVPPGSFVAGKYTIARLPLSLKTEYQDPP